MKRKYLTHNRRNAGLALLTLALGSGSAMATVGSWIPNNGSWDTAGKWTGGIPNDVGDTATFTTTNPSSNQTITLDGNRTVGILNLGSGGKTTGLTAGTGGVLIFDNTGSTNAQINVASGGKNQSTTMGIELMDSVDIVNNEPNGTASLLCGSTITVRSGASNSGNLTITNVSVGGGSPSTQFNAIISDGAGTISYKQITTGFSNFNAANTFSGNTTVSGGVLRLDNALALQNSALDTTNSILGDSVGNGTAGNGLRIHTTVGAGLTLGGLIGNKNFAATGGVINTVLGGYSAISALTLNPGTGKSHSYDGAIADGATGMTLTKTGGGTQTLGGTSTYTGDTLVSAGTLLINGSLSSSTNDVMVNNMAILGGSGSIAGTLNFQSGANFVFNVANTLAVTNGVSFSSGAFGNFGIDNLIGLNSSVAAGIYTLISGSVNMANVDNVGLANAVSLGLGKSAYLESGSLKLVVLSAIPEPSGAALLGLIGGLGFLTYRRRK